MCHSLPPSICFRFRSLKSPSAVRLANASGMVTQKDCQRYRHGQKNAASGRRPSSVIGSVWTVLHTLIAITAIVSHVKLRCRRHSVAHGTLMNSSQHECRFERGLECAPFRFSVLSAPPLSVRCSWKSRSCPLSGCQWIVAPDGIVSAHSMLWVGCDDRIQTA